MAEEFAGFAFIFNSACRCRKHNKAVGGKDDSSHVPDTNGQCNAVDIQAKTSGDKFRIVHALLLAGFTRIGVGKTFIHADVAGQPFPQKVFWLY